MRKREIYGLLLSVGVHLVVLPGGLVLMRYNDLHDVHLLRTEFNCTPADGSGAGAARETSQVSVAEQKCRPEGYGATHRELGDLGHGRVLPQAQLVLAEPVAGQDLLLVPAPLQRADLRAQDRPLGSSLDSGVPSTMTMLQRADLQIRSAD